MPEISANLEAASLYLKMAESDELTQYANQVLALSQSPWQTISLDQFEEIISSIRDRVFHKDEKHYRGFCSGINIGSAWVTLLSISREKSASEEDRKTIISWIVGISDHMKTVIPDKAGEIDKPIIRILGSIKKASTTMKLAGSAEVIAASLIALRDHMNTLIDVA